GRGTPTGPGQPVPPDGPGNDDAAAPGPEGLRAAACVKSPGGDDALFLVLERADENHDEVDEPPNTEATTRQEHGDAGADLADEESVDTEATEEEGEDGNNSTAAGAHVGR